MPPALSAVEDTQDRIRLPRNWCRMVGIVGVVGNGGRPSCLESEKNCMSKTVPCQAAIVSQRTVVGHTGFLGNCWLTLRRRP